MKPRRMSDVARAVDGLFLGAGRRGDVGGDRLRDVVPGGAVRGAPRRAHRRRPIRPRGVRATAPPACSCATAWTWTVPPVCVRSTNEALIKLARDERRAWTRRVVGVTGRERQDVDEGHDGGRPRTTVPDPREPGVVQQRGRAAGDAAGRAAPTPRSSSRRWARAAWATSRILCGIARPDVVVVTNVGRRAPGDLRVVGADRGGLGRAGRRARPRRRRGPERRRSRGGRATPAGVAAGSSRSGCRAERRCACRGRRRSARTGARRSRSCRGGERAPVTLARPRRAHGVERPRGRRGGPDARRRRSPRARPRSSQAAVSHWRMETFTTADGRARRERRLQREPRVGGGRAEGRAMDGGGRSSDRRARHDGRARPDRDAGARARRRARGAAPRRPADHGRRRRRARSRPPACARASSPTTSPPTTTPTRRSTTCGARRARATSCCSRGRAWRGSSGSRRRCDDLDPRRRRGRRSPSPCSARPSRSGRSRVWGWGQRIREDGPHTHIEKMGTPTMGGIVILLGLFAQLPRVAVHVRRPHGGRPGAPPRGRRVRRRRLPRRLPEGAQAALARADEVAEVPGHGDRVGAVRGRRGALLAPRRARRRTLSFIRTPGIKLGVLFLVWCFVVLTASSHAVNLTDGLDGLAAGSSILVLSAYIFIAFWQFRHPCSDRRRRRRRLLRGQRARDAGHRDRRRGDDGRGHRVPVVERRAGADLHGRHRVARARRAVRRPRDHARTRSSC